jgi:hypothetical protein
MRRMRLLIALLAMGLVLVIIGIVFLAIWVV